MFLLEEVFGEEKFIFFKKCTNYVQGSDDGELGPQLLIASFNFRGAESHFWDVTTDPLLLFK